MAFNLYPTLTEMDKTDIISNSLNYILLHNKNIKIEITDSNE